MRETAAFFLYLFLCLILAAALTVPLVQTGWLDYPPHRIMGRLAQLVILLGFWPFLRWRGLASRAALGYAQDRLGLAKAVAGGWLAGVAILGLLVLTLLALGIRQPESGHAGLEIVAPALQAMLAGLLIATVEETFFRGALYSGIRRNAGLIAAAGWSSLLYAALHIMKPSALPSAGPFDWPAAVEMLTRVFLDLPAWSHVDSLAALFMAGIFLALVRERSGHIGWCIGLHAGWVFVIQVTRDLSDGNPAAPLAFLAGDYDGVIGWLAALWIGLLALGLLYVSGHSSALQRRLATRRRPTG